jgi:hypothetical protein
MEAIPVRTLRLMGTAAIIPDPATPGIAAVPVTPVAAMAEEAATAEAEAEEMAVVAAAINE